MRQELRQLQILDGGQSGMTEDQEAVYAVLSDYIGRDNTIKVKQVCQLTGLNERVVRAAVRDLIMDHGIAIGSATGGGPGFYLCETDEETGEVCGRLMHRAIEIIRRVAALKRIPARQVAQQLWFKV